eukprot:2064888-Prymnesium_polylepis.1
MLSLVDDGSYARCRGESESTRGREPPLADANGQPRCAAANFCCSGCRAWAAHATDGAGEPSAIKWVITTPPTPLRRLSQQG